MCGIIGIVGRTPVAPRVVESLRRLEYRGYDSAGVAAHVAGRLQRRRAKGRIRDLEAVLAEEPLGGTVGLGHTRWATHGAPSLRNAHPQCAGRVMLVHNGIIENFAALKDALIARGRTFESDTDSEVIAQLIDCGLEDGKDPLAAFKAALDQLQGAYALGVLIDGEDNLVMGARRGSPLVVGYGQGEMFIGSDALAVGPFTQRIAYLDEGDFVAIDHQSARIFDASGAPVDRPVRLVAPSAALVEKGNYRHFMEKEIHDQPDACQHTLSAYLDPITGTAAAPEGFDFASVERLQILACGTAYYASLIGRYIIEDLAGLPVDVEVASEFRYRNPAITPATLAVAVSQSGETADTLAALRWCKAQGLRTAAIVNAPESTMSREVDLLWPTNAGPEICVLSTKAFTAQVAALTALAVAAARQRGRINAAEEKRLVEILFEAPRLLAEAIAHVDEPIRPLAQEICKARDVLYLGRGAMFGLALEGALKLKEGSYIHAEGYAAGEMKHGPIALIDEQTPVVVIAPSDSFFEKTMSNISEVIARNGKVVMITDEEGARHAPAEARVIAIPRCDPLIAPLVFAVPLQLLAYQIGVAKGADVDQPRNLAKSVTVE
ncbi:MAG TPA: glutamine--fructose-6-phosphate transaminase (isomerizing) [Caulobacteraceae bacterium]|jgi:glucosamine--fructose-6-phosphate aminotransferase (isomerizing)|nr:glutamine--fructose-6-phosphate transaminase (isomerizing) [Caulobacteraceae bacterium]